MTGRPAADPRSAPRETSPASAGALLDLPPGLAQPVRDAQAVFRVLLDAMARPGRVLALPEPTLQTIGRPLDRQALPIGAGLAALLLTLLDVDTSTALQGRLGSGAVRAWLRFHTGARELPAAEAMFTIVHAEDLQAGHGLELPLGSDEDPQRGATLIVETPRLRPAPAGAAEAAAAAQTGLQLQGPGIAGRQPLAADLLPADFWRWRQGLQALYPRGVDIFFVNGGLVAALPRSTRLVWEA